MNKKRLEQIKENTQGSADFADRTLEGDTDGYDGADGAREVRDLCMVITELVAALEKSGTIKE